MTTFDHNMTVKMYDTDAAGILYFGSQFRFAHDAFESLLEKEGISFQRFFDHEPYIFVIVHAEADYMSSLKVGDKICVACFVSKTGTTSFECTYDIKKGDLLCGRVKTVHVCIDKESSKKRSIPADFETILQTYS